MRKIFTKIIVILLIADVFWNFSLSISLGAPQMQINDGGSSSLGPTTGHTVQEAGETIAAWAIDFANKHSSQARYGGTAGYNLPVSDSDTTTKYSFHCVAFVSFVIHHALGIGEEEYTEFVKCPYASSGTSNPNNAPYVKNGFERVDCSSDEWQPGDIIVMWHHVAVYVGDGMSIGMYINDRLYYGSAISDCNGNGGYQGWVGRVTAETAANASFEYLEGAGVGGVGGLDGATSPSGVELDSEEVDLDAIADEFTFDGMPTTIIYEEQVDIFKWLFDGISGFMDYLAGILISLIKAPLLGYVYFFQLMINSFLHGLN